MERGGVRKYEVVMEKGSGLSLALINFSLSFFLLQKESHEVQCSSNGKVLSSLPF